MRRWMGLLSLALVLGTASVVSAGESEKCPLSTQECLNMMAEKMRTAGWVGVELDKDEKTGVMTVKRTFEGSPAEAAGIQPGDVLYALNGVVISDDNKEALMKARKEWKPGQAVTYTIKRNGSDRDVSLTLAPVPADVMARWIGEHMLQHASVDMAKSDTRKN
jgi:predicted metalloprotease with PDZ domain